MSKVAVSPPEPSETFLVKIGRTSFTVPVVIAAAGPDSELPQWLDKADVGTVGVLTLDDGERMTAQVVGFDEERDELVLEVISPKRSHRNGSRDGHAIPVSRIVSFEPQPRGAIVAILRSLPGQFLLACTLCPDGNDVPVSDTGQFASLLPPDE